MEQEIVFEMYTITYKLTIYFAYSFTKYLFNLQNKFMTRLNDLKDHEQKYIIYLFVYVKLNKCLGMYAKNLLLFLLVYYKIKTIKHRLTKANTLVNPNTHV